MLAPKERELSTSNPKAGKGKLIKLTAPSMI